MQNYKTTDLSIAAFLKMKGLPFKGIVKDTDSSSTVLMFEFYTPLGDLDLAEYLDSWNSSEEAKLLKRYRNNYKEMRKALKLFYDSER